MAESSSQILEEIDQERAELGANLHRLEETIRRPLHVRGFIENHPKDALIIALGTGFFLSSLIGGKPAYQRPPESREMNETLSLTGTALKRLAQQQFQQVKAAARNGSQS